MFKVSLSKSLRFQTVIKFLPTARRRKNGSGINNILGWANKLNKLWCLHCYVFDTSTSSCGCKRIHMNFQTVFFFFFLESAAASSITPPLMDPRGLPHHTTADDGVFQTMACGGWLDSRFFWWFCFFFIRSVTGQDLMSKSVEGDHK